MNPQMNQKMNRAKQKIRMWFTQICEVFPNLQQRTAGLLREMPSTAMVCVCLLTVVYLLAAMCTVFQWAEGVGTLLKLVNEIVVAPVAAGILTYIVGARWEKRNVVLVDAAQLVRIRFKEMIITGLAAGLVGIVVNWVGMMMYSLVQILSMLLGWIPVLGSLVSGMVTGILWLISLAMEFVVHTALVMGMLALTADGMSGKAQMDRVLSILRGGWRNMLVELEVVFGLWIVVRGIYEFMFRFAPVGMTLAWNVVVAVMMVVSVIAISVIYLKGRDQQNGTSYYA